MLVFGTPLLALRPSKNVSETQDEKHIHMNTPSTHNETIYTYRETEKMALAKERMGGKKKRKECYINKEEERKKRKERKNVDNYKEKGKKCERGK